MLSYLLLGGASAFLGLAAYPFTIYPLTLRSLRRLKSAGKASFPLQPDREPTFAICFSVYNEENCIEEKMRNTLALASTVSDCRIHIYVDAPTDRTVEMLLVYADRADIVVGTQRFGKTHGLNLLMRRVTNDIVVFTDANVSIDMNALLRIRDRFADPQVGCVCGHLIYTNGDESAMSAAGTLYWSLEEAIKQLESDVFNVVGADGSLFAIRRECHHPAPDDIIDDLYVSLRILCDGYRVVREPLALAYERNVTRTGDEFGRKVRIACQAFNVHKLLWPLIRRNKKLAYFYVSHRLLKWLTIYSLSTGLAFLALAMIGLFSTQIAALVFGLATLCGVVLLALGSRHAEQALAMLIACIGVGWGVWRSMRGDRYQVWTPSETARSSIAGP